jgi:phospholipid/cholesterol/gamma-HCH transport system substrate-binding protein
MNEPINKRGIAVGLFIIIGLVFLVAGVLAVGNLHSTFQKKMTVSTVFGDVNGLATGNNIWFSGVKIGTVKKIEFYGTSQVRVVMNINIGAQQYIRKDAMAKISTDGLIGNKIIVIYGGTATVPEVQEGDTLVNETALSTEDMMKTFQENNLNILKLTKKLADGEGTIGKLIGSDSLYRSISSTARSLQLASANAQQLMFSLAELSAKLNKKGALVNSLVTDTIIFNSLRSSVLQLNTIADTAAGFVNDLKKGMNDPKSPIGVLMHDEQSGGELRSTIRNLDSSSKKLDEDLEALQHSILMRKYFRKKEKISKK